jgi:hypothetical protein
VDGEHPIYINDVDLYMCSVIRAILREITPGHPNYEAIQRCLFAIDDISADARNITISRVEIIPLLHRVYHIYKQQPSGPVLCACGHLVTRHRAVKCIAGHIAAQFIIIPGDICRGIKLGGGGGLFASITNAVTKVAKIAKKSTEVVKKGEKAVANHAAVIDKHVANILKATGHNKNTSPHHDPVKNILNTLHNNIATTKHTENSKAAAIATAADRIHKTVAKK